ncbi:hypothetical protein M8J76_013256 [Diaphorina citri]|nr:hypothetical protein M8J75_009716 [Diaphorina citri]KAI5730395.1 hypothetical protein M8J76_013256 [Diaphorina citri]KAI5735929.1 hypothetical protein M8J77_024329 [Diaphorina citri]
MKFQYKEKYSLEERIKIGENLARNHPNCAFVILERSPSALLPQMPRSNYVVAYEMTVGHFFYLLRKKMALRPEEACFFFIESMIVPADSTRMETLSQRFADKDGLIYMVYSDVNIFVDE